jgi:hypothetical protein
MKEVSEMSMSIVNRSYPSASKTYAVKTNSKERGFIDVLKRKSKEAVSTESKKRVTGRWALVHTGLNSAKVVSIRHAEDSTPENPIMCTKDGNDRVHIKSIDPGNATEIEMQMFCAYLDETGRGTGSTFGTYNDLKTVRMTSQYSKGRTIESIIPTENQLKNLRCNWLDMTKKYMDIVKPNDKKQFTYLKRLYDEIQKKSERLSR